MFNVNACCNCRVLAFSDQRSNKQACSDKSEKDRAGFLDDRRDERIHFLVSPPLRPLWCYRLA